MTRYLISFDDGAMTFPEEDLPAVAEASMTVVAEARTAGVWVFGAGVQGHAVSVVDTDGAVRDEPASRRPHVGGFCVVDVASHDEALAWAARMAAACRCAQEVRELMADPSE
jgi:hypothetical protein